MSKRHTGWVAAALLVTACGYREEKETAACLKAQTGLDFDVQVNRMGKIEDMLPAQGPAVTNIRYRAYTTSLEILSDSVMVNDTGHIMMITQRKDDGAGNSSVSIPSQYTQLKDSAETCFYPKPSLKL